MRLSFRAGIFFCLLAAALNAAAQPVYTNLYAFSSVSNTNGANPGGLVSDGTLLWGATVQGGAQNSGLIYSIAPTGTSFSPVYSFSGGGDGSQPNELLLAGGTFYGTTYVGGTNGAGVVFRFDTNTAALTVLHTFTNSPDGANSAASLVLSGATLYGTSLGGGTNSSGTVFKLATNGANFTVIHNFSGGADGSAPYGRLVFVGNYLYGTASGGGSNGLGTIFSMDTNGNNYSVLYNFSNSPAPNQPHIGLTSDGGGMLYGVTIWGGNSNQGAIFAISTNGSFNVIHSLTNNDGFSPQGTLSLVNGVLFGNSLTGGTGHGGTVFELATNGANFFVVNDFTNTLTGSNPRGAVVVQNNQLSGTTYLSGPNGGGTVYGIQIIPFITLQPQPLTVMNGNPAAFTGASGGLGVLNYQWYLNGSPVAGANTSTLSYANVSPAQGGSYTLVVSNFNGSVTSSPALLTVVSAPAITQPPQNLTVTNNFSAAFTNVATGTAPLSYQWYFNTNTPVAGGTGAILVLNPATTNQAGYYTVVVSNSLGTATSAPALLSIIVPPNPPLITQQPQNTTATNGYNAAFTNIVTGDPVLVYQWYFNTNTPVVGGTNSILPLASVTTNLAGYYSCVITNNAGRATSAPALLTVVSTAPIILMPPQSLTVTNGSNVLFTVTAAGQNPLRYQWYSNSVSTAIGTMLANQTNALLNYTNAGTNMNARYYSVVVTNSLGKATSSPPALLTVIGLPVIVTNPQSASVALSNTAAFSVAALGANLRFQWYSNSVNTAIGTLLAGQTNNTYSFAALTNQNGRYFSVIVSNSFGKATSSPPAQLTVILAPVILTNPQPATINYGGATNFAVSATGANPLMYQWYFNTNTLLLNQTNTALPLTNIDNTFAGFYSVIVTNLYGRATSSPALLTVNGSAPVITLQPLGMTIAIGSSITFTSSATGPGTLGYQWFFNTNSLIAGANATNLVIAGANQPGYYAMVATNSYGAATSSPALLNLTGQAVLLSSAFSPASGSYSFTYINLAGSTNRLWATTNLANSAAWQAIATNIMATNGTWNFTDTNTAKTNAIRLYRFSTP